MWKCEQLYARLYYIHLIMLHLLDRPGFLTLKHLHLGELVPVRILLKCVVEAGLQPKRGRNFMQSASRGIGPASRCKLPLRVKGPFDKKVLMTYGRDHQYPLIMDHI
jgi:hypothetical protein